MATIEPGQLFQFDRPLERAVVDARLVREMFTALAQTNYTSSAAYPNAPRIGMLRISAVDPSNIKLEVFVGAPLQWRTLLQNIQLGVAVPVKQIVQFAVPSLTWTVDHNLGSQPLVQVFDASFNSLPTGVASAPLYLGHVPAAVLLTRAGVETLRAAFVLPGSGGAITATRAVCAEGVSGTPTGSLQFTLSGAGGPMTGGDIPVVASGLGAVLPGNPVTGNNVFVGGDTLLVETNFAATATGGALDVYADITAVGGYAIANPTVNRVIVTHQVPTAGFLILVG